MTGRGAPEPAAAVRPRPLRLLAFAGSVLVTSTAILGGLGVLPSGGQPSYAAGDSTDRAVLAAQPPATDEPAPSAEAGAVPGRYPGATTSGGATSVPTEPATDAPLPADSGEGRRVVFDMDQQRVWLVGEDDQVQRTYPVSGSAYDNLEAGTYEVFSRSRDAVGIDGTTMRYMVRFAHGPNAAIGFHDIPLRDGERVQTRAELGTALSHGCVRQWPVDARALWRFAPLGTTVVVTD